MEVHQKEFLVAVVLAAAMALATAAWDKRQEHVHGAPVGKAEAWKSQVRTVAFAGKPQAPRDATVRQ